MSFALIIEPNPRDSFVKMNGKIGRVFRFEPNTKVLVEVLKENYLPYTYEIRMPYTDTKISVELQRRKD